MELTTTKGQAMLTITKVAQGYAAVALNWGIASVLWGEWALWVGGAVAVVATVCYVALWRNEAPMREMAREGYVEGQPVERLTWADSWVPAVYARPSYSSHVVVIGDVDVYVAPECLRPVRVDIRL